MRRRTRLTCSAALAAVLAAGCASSPPPPSGSARVAQPSATAAAPRAPVAARPPQAATPAPASARQVTAVPLPPLTPAARAAHAQAQASQAAAVQAVQPAAPAAAPPPGAASVPAPPPPSAAGSAQSRPATPVAASPPPAARAPATDTAQAAEIPAVAGHADEVFGDVVVYRTRYEDTLLDIGLSNSLGFLEILAANPGVDPWLPGDGTEVLLPKARILPTGPRDGIVLNLAEQRLFLFRKGELAESFPIGVFRDGFSTPLGSTTIVRKTVNPTWYPPPSARADDPELPAAVPPGPDNPLGTRAMYLGWARYLIHGTHKPYGVGRRVSRGCIRMYPADAERLYDMVGVGTRVHVVNQPIKVGWWRGELFVQAHPTIEQGIALEETGKIEPVEVPDIRDKLEAKAGPAAERIDWPTVERALKERRGVPVQVTNVTRPVGGDPRPVAMARTLQPPAAPPGLAGNPVPAPIATALVR